MATDVLMPNEIDPDIELTSFLSTKVTDCFTSWMQSNYFNLFTNYKTIFNAYNELQIEYNKIKHDNNLKANQIENLQTQIKSVTSISPLDNTENMNNRYLKENNKLQYKIKILENEIIETENKLKENKEINNKYQNEIRYLQEENKHLKFKSDFNNKCTQNEISLKEMNCKQTKQKYDQLITNHINNIKSMHSFLNGMKNRWQMFLNQYSNDNNNNNNNNNNNILAINDNNNNINHNNILTTDIQ
eukprot:493130_1